MPSQPQPLLVRSKRHLYGEPAEQAVVSACAWRVEITPQVRTWSPPRLCLGDRCVWRRTYACDVDLWQVRAFVLTSAVLENLCLRRPHRPSSPWQTASHQSLACPDALTAFSEQGSSVLFCQACAWFRLFEAVEQLEHKGSPQVLVLSRQVMLPG